jgi:hypothetical protein
VPQTPSLSELSRAELDALLVKLFGDVAALGQMVSEQREEIDRLKGLKGPPDIKPRGMGKATGPIEPGWRKHPRRGKVRPPLADRGSCADRRGARGISSTSAGMACAGSTRNGWCMSWTASPTCIERLSKTFAG